MEKFFAEINICCGVECAVVVEASTFSKAEEEIRKLVIDFADEYGFQQDEDHFGGCLDSLGKDWDEEDQEYEEVGNLDYHVEYYFSEEHEGLLCG